MSRLDEIRKLKEEYDRRLKDEGQAIIKETFDAFFEAAPKVKAVVWSQYTPYFNDGDACTFSVHERKYVFDSDSAKDDEDGADDGDERETDDTPDLEGFYSYDEVRIGGKYYPAYEPKHYETPPETRAAGGLPDEAADLLDPAFDEDLMGTVFGDHSKIIATRDGFDVRDYSDHN